MIDVNEDLIALTKLQSYIDNCVDIERAKNICGSFLKKYDPDKVPIPVKQQTGQLQSFHVQTDIDDLDLERYGPDLIAAESRSGLQKLLGGIYDSGFIYNAVSYDPIYHRYNITQSVDVLNPYNTRKPPQLTVFEFMKLKTPKRKEP